MVNYYDLAVEALKNYLISLIQGGNFCSARNIGNALEEVLRTQCKIPQGVRSLGSGSGSKRHPNEVCEEDCASEQEY